MEKSYIISQDIYPSEIIDNTIIVFEEFADITYVNGELKLNGENQGEIDELFNEFMNYVIYLINE